MRIKLNSERDTLDARLEIGKKTDAFLVCHGFGGSMYEPEETSVMDDLAGMEYSCMLLSHRTGRPADLIFQEQVRQLVDAVTYLLGEVRAKRVHLFGISMGGANVISTAGIEDRIASVASSSGISDCALWIKHRQGEKFASLVREAARNELSQLKGGSGGKLWNVPELLGIPESEPNTPKVKGRTTKVSARTIRSLLTYKPILAAPGITDKPAFFFHGTGDQLVSHEHTLMLYNATRTKKKYKLLIEGGDHGMILEKPVRDRILNFYLNRLRKEGLLKAA